MSEKVLRDELAVREHGRADPALRDMVAHQNVVGAITVNLRRIGGACFGQRHSVPRRRPGHGKARKIESRDRFAFPGRSRRFTGTRHPAR